MFILKQYPVMKHYQNYQQADTRWVSEWVLGFSSLRGLLPTKLETVMVAENIYMSPAYTNTLTYLHKNKQIFVKVSIIANSSQRNLRLWWWQKIYMFSEYMDTSTKMHMNKQSSEKVSIFVPYVQLKISRHNCQYTFI